MILFSSLLMYQNNHIHFEAFSFVLNNLITILKLSSISCKSRLICQICWPRATLKGPERSFVVLLVLVLVGVESSSKNALNQTKIVQGNKKYAREQKNFLQVKNSKLQWKQSFIFTLWNWMAMFALQGLVWSWMALCGLIWPCCISGPWPSKA